MQPVCSRGLGYPGYDHSQVPAWLVYYFQFGHFLKGVVQ